MGTGELNAGHQRAAISELIKKATAVAEEFTGRALRQRSWNDVLAAWPSGAGVDHERR